MRRRSRRASSSPSSTRFARRLRAWRLARAVGARTLTTRASVARAEPRSPRPSPRASSARSSPSSSATSSARRRSASRPIPRRCARGCAATSRICASSSSATAAPSRSSSATRSWPSSASPISHEDDALRAVRAAAEMQAAIAEHGLEARIGVNTGEVVVGGEGETLVTGDAVNVAARLEQAAARGETLIGAETRALVRDAVRVEPVEPLDAEGEVGARRGVPAPRGARPTPRRSRATRRRRSSVASASASGCGATTRTRSPTARAGSSLCSALPGSASRASSPTSSSVSAARPTSCAAAASRTARGSPTGRSSRS